MLPIALRLVRAATAVLAIAAMVGQIKVLAEEGKLDLVNFLSFFTVAGLGNRLAGARRGAAA